MVSLSSLPSASSIFSAFATISSFIMLLRTVLEQMVPHQLQRYVVNLVGLYFRPSKTGNAAVIVIEERDGMCINEVYSAAEIYLCTKARPNIDRMKLIKHHQDDDFRIRFAQSERIIDSFEGMELQWKFIHQDIKQASNEDMFEPERRYFELCFDKKLKEKVLDSYIPFVLETVDSIMSEKKEVKLHTLASGSAYASSVVWDSISLRHPSTFETLAMDPGQKKCIIEDLDRFLRRKELYRKVGKAWKRGYLLYGPPGTGKSSLIAAIANYLKFDIYDLELTNVRHDSELRKLLLWTTNRSILVIEDIDCTITLPDRNGIASGPDKKFTLSGLLNFIDGLWSSCGDERIIIFTTNNKEKLDPALLRPGRMDMHIHMSYLTPEGFNLLASNYLNAHDHPFFKDIRELIQTIKVTPAEVAEELMKNDDADTCLDALRKFLKKKRSQKLILN